MTTQNQDLRARRSLLVDGADATRFLHAQLTAPFGEDQAPPMAAWCDPKGRVQALFTVEREAADRWRLLLPAESAARVAQRLGMYILRSAVTLTEEDAPDDDLAAALAAGEPRSGEATAGSFLPQMLDLEALGGLSHQKGCYPGQEVVARTHNLGKLKRRMRRYRCDGPLPEPGEAVLDADGGNAGRVLYGAEVDGQPQLLAVVEDAAVSGDLALSDATRLTEVPLR